MSFQDKDSIQKQLPIPSYAVGNGWGMAGGCGFPPFCSEMGWWAAFPHSASQCPHGQTEASSGQSYLLGPRATWAHPEGRMAHGCVSTVVDRVSTVRHQLIHNLHGPDPLSWSFPITTTSQPLTLLSIGNHSTLQQVLIERALLGVSNMETLTGQRHTGPLWPLFL